MLWIFLPAYNEEASLPRLLPRLREVMEKQGQQYRVVVVDDGSTDATPRILDHYRRSMPLEVLTHPLNRGLGETERDGFEWIAFRCHPEDVIVRVEGDDTHDPGYIIPMLERLEEGYDVVNTSRYQPGGGQEGIPGNRAFISHCAGLFMKAVFAIPGVRDYSCGFRAYRARVIQDAIRVFGDRFLELRCLGFASTLEILVKLHLLGCRFAEVPFVLHYEKKRSASKMAAGSTILGYLALALLDHFPGRGWKSRYRGLAELYRRDRAAALERFGRFALPRFRGDRRDTAVGA